MKFLIIEVTDRTGKDTLISSLMKECGLVILRHFSKAIGENDEEKMRNQIHLFSSEMKKTQSRKIFENDNLIEPLSKKLMIWNRSHLGDFVYGSLYRDTKPQDWVINLETQFGFDTDDEIYLVLLTGDPTLLAINDDGDSFSSEIEDKTKELKLFDQAISLSKIKNKLIINVTDTVDEISIYKSPDKILQEVKNFVWKNL
jgi:hypothetical protein